MPNFNDLSTNQKFSITWYFHQRKGDMSDLTKVIFLKFVRLGANSAQTIDLGYSLMGKSRKIWKLKINP